MASTRRLTAAEDEELAKRRQQAKAFREQIMEKPVEEPTLLWRVPANAVSLATGTTMFTIRAGVSAAKWGLKAGRQATYGVIGLNQTILESVLRAAGNDVAHAQPDVPVLRQQEAYYLVDKWVSSLHTALSGISVLAASGFYVAEHTLNATEQSSLLGLHFLNSIFGSTDASRAVAALVQLMKKELHKPGEDGSDAPIHTYELLTSVSMFLFMQRSGRRQTDIEWRNSGGDVSIWDIVVDDRGFRADVIGTKRPDVIADTQEIIQSPANDEPQEDFATIAGQIEGGALSGAMVLSGQEMSGEEIAQRIQDQLPPGSRATVTNETVTLKTIRVDIHASENVNIEAPPGTIMVSEHTNAGNSTGMQTIVFRSASKAIDKSIINPAEAIAPNTDATDEPKDAADEGALTMSIPSHPRVSFEEHLDRNLRDRSSQSHTYSKPLPETPSRTSRGPIANQKKVRKSVSDGTALPPSAQIKSQIPERTARQDKSNETNRPDRAERTGMFKKALKSLSPTQSSAAINRMVPSSSRHRSGSTSGLGNALSETLKPLTTSKTADRKPSFHISNTQPNTPAMSPNGMTPAHESAGGTYFTVHHQRTESSYSQTDTYSLHSNDSRPPSPNLSRTHLRASNSISKTHSSTNISMYPDEGDGDGRHHRRSRSFVPSLYSMGTKDSEGDTLVLAPRTPVPRKSIFEDYSMIATLMREGRVPGQYPRRHLIWSVHRFCKFASGVYGKNFLTFMGMTASPDALGLGQTEKVVRPNDMDPYYHVELESFANHTGLPRETILKSSYLEPYGIESKAKSGFAPLIHIISADLQACAVVLTIRGTLGFEDLLTDAACDYADLYWRGHAYKVHRGIRDAARRLMDSAGGNTIMATLKATLEEFPDFGLVITGHSLGGAVAALLAIMLSEPSQHEPGKVDEPAFVTATRPKLIPSTAHAATSRDVPPIALPAGRSIHAYAYGAPACVASDLRIATRGLITTTINANDIVPYLSLGTLHDFKAISRRLKQDLSGKITNMRDRAKERVISSIWHFFYRSVDSSSSAASPPPSWNFAGDALGEDSWMWHELCETRALMNSEKLYPPGEVFTLENTRVFDRDPDETTTSGVESSRDMHSLGRAATRIQYKWVRDVETRFNEVRFTRSMFREHTPFTYETHLDALKKGLDIE